MTLPFIIHALVFSYIPIWGWVRAFFEYKLGSSIMESKFIGFKYFHELFTSRGFYLALRNTLVISILNLIVGTFCSVVFAILLNELKHVAYKRVIQTVSYLPHFVSWVIVAGLFSGMLAIDNGLLNDLLIKLRMIDTPIPFMLKGRLFWFLVTFMNIWKETGWGAIIYLAVMTTINPELYEAAIVDGAGRLRRIWHITVPGIKNTIIVMLVLQTGWLLGTGFEQSLLLGNGAIMEYSDVIATYTLRYGIQMGRFSYATAAGLFQTVVGFLMVLVSNFAAKKFSDTQIF